MQKATSLQRTQVFLSYTLFLAKVAHVYVIDFVLFNHIPKLFNASKRMKVKQGTTKRKRKNHTFEQDKTNSRRKL